MHARASGGGAVELRSLLLFQPGTNGEEGLKSMEKSKMGKLGPHAGGELSTHQEHPLHCLCMREKLPGI